MTIRFGVVATPRGDARAWAAQVAGFEAAGWHAVLVPDTLWTTSPFPALAAAAAATTRLRLRPWVVAAPFRTPGALAREASALQELSGGRFELGIGAGRPDAEGEAARLGAAWGSAGERIAALERAVTAVREGASPAPPVTIAASGPRLLALAGRLADRVAPALPPTATEGALAAAVEAVRAAATARAAPPGITQSIVGIGDHLPARLEQRGLTASTLAAGGAAGLLPADPDELAELLQKREAQYGVDEYAAPEELAQALKPTLARLST
jgi:alkanesulfonate monooxygenase SsuD/methylene tetrahydromethanopterin reductase-like flavin-dependent oxidoreductase (luciferase family)